MDADVVRHIGKLSRIELTDEEMRTFPGQLTDVLQYFDKLQELDTENVTPMVHAVELKNILAADIPHESLTPDEALKNAPDREGDFFRVTKVLGAGS
ncbi:MAG: Asp-tRNA(Asn)/Glu-tRNA(Gln) amidotransferase subunit GatC [Phycisphaerae bacterium]|nr:Asp-tRNA(Asn)/Glu-tRNA(Gln) amidotransferase subunit GatC [Phycisphaerae bacterium]